jgi:transcriptional regulator with XRE-family HTH domain
MKGADLKEFRIVNNLTQTELGDYLGVQKGFISKIENGRDKLPEQKFRKLLNNPNGWDVSMLTQSDALAEENPSTDSTLIAELRSQIEKLEAKVDNLNQELGEKNALIKMMSQGGSGIAQVADGSLSANVG